MKIMKDDQPKTIYLILMLIAMQVVIFVPAWYFASPEDKKYGPFWQQHPKKFRDSCINDNPMPTYTPTEMPSFSPTQ